MESQCGNDYLPLLNVPQPLSALYLTLARVPSVGPADATPPLISLQELASPPTPREMLLLLILACLFVALAVVWRKRTERARRERPASATAGSHLMFSVAMLALLAVVGFKGDVALAASASLASEFRSPPWESDRAPYSAFSREEIERASGHAEDLLAHQCLIPPRLDKRWLSKYFDALPDRVVQRSRFDERRMSKDGKGHESAFHGFGVLAEASSTKGGQICLYADQLRDSFLEAQLSPAAFDEALAFTLLHEIFHLPAAIGGLCQNGVPGDTIYKSSLIPHAQHVGLHCWIGAVAARCATIQDTNSDALVAACYHVRQTRALLSGSSSYASCYKEKRSGGQIVGPPAWQICTLPSAPNNCER